MSIAETPHIKADFVATRPGVVDPLPPFIGDVAAYTEFFRLRETGNYYSRPELGIFDAAWKSEVDLCALKNAGGRFVTAHFYGDGLQKNADIIAALRRHENASFVLVHARVEFQGRPEQPGHSVRYHSVALKIDFEKRKMHYVDSDGKTGMQDNVRAVLEKALDCDLINRYVRQQENDAACSLYTYDNLKKLLRSEEIAFRSPEYMLDIRRVHAPIALAQIEKHLEQELRVSKSASAENALQSILQRNPKLDVGQHLLFVPALVLLEKGLPLDEDLYFSALKSWHKESKFAPRNRVLAATNG